jgi:hypothetical protein
MASLKSIAGACAFVALSAGAGAVAAQELSVDKSRLYVTDPAACQKLETQGTEAFNDMDFLSLSFTDGIQGMEFHCNFFDVKGKKGNSFLFVDAVCELPGEVYPDIMSISPYDDTTIQVVSSNDSMMAMGADAETSEGETTDSGVTLYHRCDNLSELPR